MIDRRNSTIIVPISGLAIPFHITALKNISKTDEGEFATIRMNLVAPGQAGSKKEDQVAAKLC